MLPSTLLNRFLVVLLVMFLGACGGAENRKAEYMSQANESFAAKDYDKAKLGYKNAIQIDPKDVEPRIGLAKVLVATQEWRQAAGQYQGVLEVDPDHLEAAVELGKLFLLARATEQALEQAGKVLEKDPSHIGGLTLKAGILSQQGANREALDILAQLHQSHPSNHDATVLYTTLLNQEGQFGKALEVLKSAIANSDQPNDLYGIQAMTQDAMGDKDSAKTSYHKLIEINPSVFAHKQRYVAYLIKIGEIDSAKAFLEQHIAADEDDIELRKGLVDLLVKDKQFAEAEKRLKTFSKQFDEPEFDMGLARLKLIEGKQEEAAAQFEAILKRFPETPTAASAELELVKLELQDQKMETAKQRLDKLIERFPKYSDALLLRGNIALREGRATDAINDFRPVLNDDPDNVVVMRSLADAHFQANELELASNYYKQLSRRIPGDLLLKNSLANIAQRMGKVEEAINLRRDIQLAEPNSQINLTELAKLYGASARFDDLNTVAELLMGLENGAAVGHYFKGLALQGKQAHEKAVEQFDKSLAVAPAGIEPISAKTKSLLVLEQSDRAKDWLASLIEEGVNVPLSSNLLAEILMLEKDFEGARKLLKQAIDVNSQWVTPRKNLALTFRAENRLVEAKAALQEAIAEVENNLLLRSELAQVMEATQDYDGAISQYEAIYEVNGSQLAANNLAMLIVTYKSDEASLEKASKIAETLRGSTNPMFMDTLGWIYLKRSQIDLAFPLIKEAANKAPEIPQINYHLALAYKEKQDVQAAITHLERALESGQSFSGRSEAEGLLTSLKES